MSSKLDLEFPHRTALIIPGTDTQPAKYLPHLKYIDDYIKAGLVDDEAGQIGTLMIATIVALQRYAAKGNIAQPRAREAVRLSAAATFFAKLRKFF